MNPRAFHPLRLSFLRLAFTLALSAALHWTARADVARGYYRFPTLQGQTVVFTAEGDLWRVGLSGGTGQRLTSHPGLESNAAISPDGKWLAFSGQYEGPTEVYVMPLAGGRPERLTFEGESAQVRGWTPDGRVLYSTRHFSTLPDAQLVAIEPKSRDRRFIPLAQADEGVYDDSGHTLFFTRFAFQGSNAKRYRGGTAQSLWRWAEGEREATALTADFPGTSRWPMWWAGRVYFASDRDGTMNLWSMKPDGSDLRQQTHHADFGVKNPSQSGGRIVYQNGADLWLCDLTSGKTTILPITLESDFDQLRERWVTKPGPQVTHFDFSPTGDRIAFTVRGKIFVVPAEQGRTAEITHRSGVRYRDAVFAPNGKDLFFLSDESGETEFWREAATGEGPLQAVTHDAANLRKRGLPSPDGQSIAYVQQDGTLWVANIGTGVSRPVATAPHGEFQDPELSWSPDGRWLAYANGVDNQNSVLFLYSLADGSSTAVTSERVNSGDPVFSPDGRWLYFLSERSFHSAITAPWGSYQPEPYIDKPAQVFQLALGEETRSPFQPLDELAPVENSVAAALPASPDAKKAAKPAATVHVVREGIQSRLWQVPISSGRYRELHVTDKALYLLDTDPRDAKGETHSRLIAVEIKRKDPQPVVLRPDVKSYRVSADGRKLLVQEKEDYFALDAGCAPIPTVEKAKVNVDAVKFSFLPAEDWRDILVDAWRMHRDFFYDKGMHGVDWKANLAKHLPLVDRVTDRTELDDVIAYLISEVGALHANVIDPDPRKGADDIKVASLGVRWSRDPAAGGYRVDHIYQGDPDFLEKLSPLAKPGVGIHEGDVIAEINGQPTLAVLDPAALLRNQAGLQVLLRVLSGKRGGAAFSRIVLPIDPVQEAALRYSDWEISRRARVDAASARSIGYVHLRAMGGTDYEQWAQNFYPVLDRPGLILDLRHNRGGNIDSWLLSRLMRRDWMWWAPRSGRPVANMQLAFRSHLIVLVDAWTASDGETMANGVRHLGLGKILGMRTWGGGIWLSDQNQLIDGGIARAGEMGTYIPGEGWAVENRGITPDFTLDNPPAATFGGQDAQLDAAVKYLQEEIKKDPKAIPEPPPYPRGTALP